jgi:predicted AAA+ superfamily ATPase
MATSNHERVGKALELLNAGVLPFFERELQAHHGEDWQEKVAAGSDDRLFDSKRQGELIHWDTHMLLSVMWSQWNSVFGRKLGHAERSLVSELSEVRNRWAHQKSFSVDDTYRALDSMQRFLSAISAPEAEEIDKQKQQILRQRFDEQAKRETKRAAESPVEGRPAGGLKPWREIITPHPDVASGRYQQAEFAADLNQVHRGEGTDEYKNPKEFFQRTFVTDGLKHLLSNALKRLVAGEGDPVVELQTNFGGGKTHSMLALYHLAASKELSELSGIEPILKSIGIDHFDKLPRRAVLVGTAISPGQSHRKPDGTNVNTLWGELAWQLGEAAGNAHEAFALVADADARGVSPGSNSLRDLFTQCGPCLILIDEWIAFVRQLYGVDGLPAGSFDANLTFAQALTEAARQAPNTLLVASIPSSDIEIGGPAGREALERLKNTFGRMESTWRPATAEEGFEIVRRRLFQPIIDPQKFAERDAVVRAYMDLYRSQPAEFPSECREGAYERRLTAAYPIHPELFDRLYIDWSSLDKFQRTRGVLRLMAAVIHTLWERQDGSLMIMPASIPIDAHGVQSELTRYLEDTWLPVIEKDVDGLASLPLQLDRANPNLGRYSACRRVARTLYLGSAATLNTAQRGLEDNRIKLGCVQPGETVATFGDALRRLTDQATHLYVHGSRYWFSTQPSVTRLAQDRANEQKVDIVLEEVRRRLREYRDRGDFAKVHPCPSRTDVPDEREARLVILDPEFAHSARATDSPARQEADQLLSQRGQSPRLYRNSLVFLAADRNRLAELDQAVRQYLAWKSIDAEHKTLNLDAFQSNQAETKRKESDDTVRRRIPETYHWLLVPTQPSPQGAVEWQELKVNGDDSLAVRASKKLKTEEMLITKYAATLLRREIDRIPLWRGDHVTIKQLWDDFAQYLYLPRLKDSEVLLNAISDGLSLMTWEQETFAYAEGWDEDRKLYRGLRAGGYSGRIALDNSGVVIKPEAAIRQRNEQGAAQAGSDSGAPAVNSGGSGTTAGGGLFGEGAVTGTEIGEPPPPVKARRFHGVVSIDPTRLSRDTGTIAEAVVQHLAGLMDSEVEVTLEIHAEIPDGAPDDVVRTVTENCRTLKFETFGFEES